MKNRNPPRPFPLYAMLHVVALGLGAWAWAGLLTSGSLAQTGAQSGTQISVANRDVVKRMDAMVRARLAVETLTQMMAGRARFNRANARAARRDLITVTGAIPRQFRKPHSDPLSRARPLIWLQWDDFRTRAEATKKTAQALRVERLERLRLTLPGVINSCLACHKIYRNPG